MDFHTYARFVVSLFLIFPVLAVVVGVKSAFDFEELANIFLGGVFAALISNAVLLSFWPIVAFVFTGKVVL